MKAGVRFGTKAATLECLAPRLTSARVLPMLRFAVEEWRVSRAAVLKRLQACRWSAQAVIVRSSAALEDAGGSSMAGRFLSVPDVAGKAELCEAVEKVIRSYGPEGRGDEVFVQPMIKRAVLSGVAFSREPSSGAPYAVINYDDRSGATDSVTSGLGENLRTMYWYRDAPVPPPKPLDAVAALLAELEALLDCDAIDLEFAVTREDGLVLLQVRQLTSEALAVAVSERHRETLAQIRANLEARFGPHPYLHGTRTVFGVMPDWNPAEIIGVRPRPLALSLYKELVTDSIWAYQRDNYGYRNLRSFPLLVSFAGLPYIDVRVSFNSFIPADVRPELSERLVNYYIASLIDSPSHHDKVEFEIIFSCYTLDLPQRLEALAQHGFAPHERAELEASLRRLTNRIIHGEKGLWRGDIERIQQLDRRRITILHSRLDHVAKIYWLLEDCKRYGTLPFAGLARAGFIAVQLLKSLVSTGVFTAADYENFMTGIDTVGSRMGRDLRALGRAEFLERYGHLRPGTYNILSPRYDEAPDLYFDWPAIRPAEAPQQDPFTLSLEQLRRAKQQLGEHGLEHDALGLFDFIKAAIEGREHAKFVFTRSLSDALRLLKQLGEAHGLTADEMSLTDVACIRQLCASSDDVAQVLRASAAQGARNYTLTQQIILPPLVTTPEDAWGFHLPPSEPNYVTMKSARGPVRVISESAEGDLRGAILMIPSADPGYDWIFARGIAGFITMFGGVNSHMAIRAGELGIPAVVGAGKVLYEAWSGAGILEVDCPSRQVRKIR